MIVPFAMASSEQGHCHYQGGFLRWVAHPFFCLWTASLQSVILHLPLTVSFQTCLPTESERAQHTQQFQWRSIPCHIIGPYHPRGKAACITVQAYAEFLEYKEEHDHDHPEGGLKHGDGEEPFPVPLLLSFAGTHLPAFANSTFLIVLHLM